MIKIKTKGFDVTVDTVNEAVEVLHWLKYSIIPKGGLICERCEMPRAYGSVKFCRECYLDTSKGE